MDALDQKLERLLEINQETLTAIKRMGDIQDLKIVHLEKENVALWEENRRASEARKGIYTRIERVERRCAGLHGEAKERSGDKTFEEQAVSFLHGNLGKIVMWGCSIAAAVIITKWANSL